MRPRVFPAEDPRQIAERLKLILIASMRPRVFPAEDKAQAEKWIADYLLQ